MRVFPLDVIAGEMVGPEKPRPLTTEELIYHLETSLEAAREHNLLLLHQLDQVSGNYTLYQAWLKTIPKSGLRVN